MQRHEVAAIIGTYSRQGFTARAVQGGFMVQGIGFRSTREARIDTQVNYTKHYPHHNELTYARGF